MPKDNIRVQERREYYDGLPPPDKATSIKTSKKAAGALSSGFNKLDMPQDKPAKVPHITSERDHVGSPWKPGPGKQHHGKASPANHGDAVKVGKNHVTQGK